MIVIVNYGLGNLHSVRKALEIFTKDVIISDKPWDIKRADKIILPGVGHFRDAMCKIKKLGIFEALIEAAGDKPFLGICLGMQILFEESEEGKSEHRAQNTEHRKVESEKGLSIFKGRVVRFPRRLKVPHIGWNMVRFNKHPLFQGIPEKSWFYFANSYYPIPDEDVAIATTGYGDIEFVSAVSKGYIFGCQFHPEKSSNVGLKMIENFVLL